MGHRQGFVLGCDQNQANAPVYGTLYGEKCPIPWGHFEAYFHVELPRDPCNNTSRHLGFQAMNPHLNPHISEDAKIRQAPTWCGHSKQLTQLTGQQIPISAPDVPKWGGH